MLEAYRGPTAPAGVTGDGTPGAFHEEIWDGGRQSQFVAILGCGRSGGCPQSGEAKTLEYEYERYVPSH